MLEIKFYNHNLADFCYDLAKLATEGGNVFLPNSWVEIKSSKSNIILYCKDITWGTKQKIAEYHNPGGDAIKFVKNQLLYKAEQDVEKFNTKMIEHKIGVLKGNYDSEFEHIIWLSKNADKKIVFKLEIDKDNSCYVLSNENHKQVIPFSDNEEVLIYYYCDCFAKYDWLNVEFQFK